MDIQECVVKGGVLIAHQLHEGKHQYQVENVLKYKKACGQKMFVRRGDRLMQINGMDLQDLTPDELAQTLAEGSPMLTVHKAGRTEGPRGPSSAAAEVLCPVSKEATVLAFSMEMRREGDGDGDGQGGGDRDMREDGCHTGDPGEGDEGGQGLLVVSMTRTSISVVTGRGCDKGSPCHGCNGTGCTFNDIVVMAESSEVRLVPRGSGSFSREKSFSASIKNVATHQYLRGLCMQKSLYASPNPERITIYSYKYTGAFRGTPVVLNLTESNCFLRCYKDGERVFLQVETCEKQRLRKISTSDESTMSFLFYLKSAPSKHKKFESALHHGWFIHILDTDIVGIATPDGGHEEQSFVFIIQK